MQVAKVIQLADETPHNDDEVSSGDKKILDVIKKCLARANHPNTAELEAKTAWRMSTRLMQQYNVTHSDLLEKVTNQDDYAAIWGQSVVSISRAKNDGRRVTDQLWVSHFGIAMAMFFDCKLYNTARVTSIDWTFYGIAANTVPAAMAFEMARNLALEWARSKGRDKVSYCLGIGEGLVEQADQEKYREKKRAENMERQQVERDNVDGEEPARIHNDKAYACDPSGPQHVIILQAATNAGENSKHAPMVEDLEGQDEKPASLVSEEDEKKIAIKSEESDDETYETDGFMQYDSEGEDKSALLDQGYVSDEDEMEIEPTFKEEDEKPIDLKVDFEEQLREAMPAQQSANPPTLGDNGVEDIGESDTQLTANAWNTTQALVRFRQCAEKVATEYLKAHNVKVTNVKARPVTIRNGEVHRQGMEDSKKIDVKRRRIEGTDAKARYCSKCGRYLLVGPPAPEYPGEPTKVECQCMDE